MDIRTEITRRALVCVELIKYSSEYKTDKDICEALQVQTNYIYKWRGGTAWITSTDLHHLCTLGASGEYLLTGKGQPLKTELMKKALNKSAKFTALLENLILKS